MFFDILSSTCLTGFLANAFPSTKSGSKPIILFLFSLIINSPTCCLRYLLDPFGRFSLYLTWSEAISWIWLSKLKEKTTGNNGRTMAFTAKIWYKGLMMCHLNLPFKQFWESMHGEENIMSRFEPNLRPWLVSELPCKILGFCQLSSPTDPYSLHFCLPQTVESRTSLDLHTDFSLESTL